MNKNTIILLMLIFGGHSAYSYNLTEFKRHVEQQIKRIDNDYDQLLTDAQNIFEDHGGDAALINPDDLFIGVHNPFEQPNSERSNSNANSNANSVLNQQAPRQENNQNENNQDNGQNLNNQENNQNLMEDF